MSKRLQITITDGTYEKLLKICNETGSPKGWPKSFVIEMAIFDFYQRIDKHNGWSNWKSITSEIK